MRKKKISGLIGDRIGYILLSIFIACCLWLYVVSVENKDIDVEIANIPVVFIGEDELLSGRGLMLASGKEAFVTLEVRGKRTVVSKLDRSNVTVAVDISNITAVGEYTKPFSIAYPSGILESDVLVLSRSQYTISFTIDKQASKTIELRGVLEGDIAEGYLAEEFEFSPNEVSIRGAEELISKVDHALVVVSRTNVNKTISITSKYQLIDRNGEEISAEGIILETEEVLVTLPVIQQKEIWLSVDLEEGGGASKEDAVVTIDPPYIVVAGDPDILSTLNNITVALIDLHDVINSATETFPIVLVNGVKNISGETVATVTISLENLETRSINVTEFELRNVPDGYEAHAVTQTLKVGIRGKKGTVGQILESNVVAVADLSGLGTGTMSVPVEVIINSKTNAGVVGNYSIYVEISPK